MKTKTEAINTIIGKIWSGSLPCSQMSHELSKLSDEFLSELADYIIATQPNVSGEIITGRQGEETGLTV